MTKVLMVCLGNICRSPMAEGILRKKVAEKNLAIEVDSAGTAAYHIGEAPDSRSIAKSAEYGIDISGLRGRQITKEDYDRFDYILAMDYSNYENILALTKDGAKHEKVEMVLNYSQPNSNMSVPDPYYGDEDGFENVYRLLDHALDQFLLEIENEKA